MAGQDERPRNSDSPNQQKTSEGSDAHLLMRLIQFLSSVYTVVQQLADEPGVLHQVRKGHALHYALIVAVKTSSRMSCPVAESTVESNRPSVQIGWTTPPKATMPS